MKVGNLRFDHKNHKQEKTATWDSFNSTKRNVISSHNTSNNHYSLSFFSRLLGTWTYMNQGKFKRLVGNNLIGSRPLKAKHQKPGFSLGSGVDSLSC